MNAPHPPKGSLEDLFRHHLASEAAAVPPRPQVWEQLDNRLLLAENAHYRRRLRTHRWALAASLLLASLAGGGWWQSQRTPSAPLATAAAPAAAARQVGLAAARRAAGNPAPGRTADLITSNTSKPAQFSSTTNPSAIAPTATILAAAASTTSARTAVISQPGRRASSFAAGSTGAAGDAASPRRRALLSRSPGRAAGEQDSDLSANAFITSQERATGARRAGDATFVAAGLAAPTGAAQLPPSAGLLAAELPSALDSLAARPASLVALAPAAPPASLSLVALAPLPAPTLARHWQFGLGYAVSAFQPNIDFAKDPASYNLAFGGNSATLTRAAAAEYRSHLRPGLGQRLSLWATRRLGASRWGLRTGLELSQHTASSATSVAFVGEQVADLSYTTYSAQTPQLHGTSFRYRAASIPVEARYSNPAKTGFSLYGRLGALLTALLNVRSEVAGNPEATRTYSLASASTPYRHLALGLRGGGGLQYRPAGHEWALSLGPVAELGVLSMNADPSQDFLHQQRPYSFGFEASVELGRPPKPVLVP